MPAKKVFLGLSFLLFTAPFPPAQASSHREAPAISQDPTADQTDLYAFVSPQDDRRLVLVGNYSPFQVPNGGPHFYRFGDDVIYAFHIDNNGNNIEDITYAFDFDTHVRNGTTFRYNSKPIQRLGDTNVNQSFEVRRIEGVFNAQSFQKGRVIARGHVAPPAIGEKSQPNYEHLVHQSIVDKGVDGIFFTGQRDDPFFMDLNIFDLLDIGEGKDSLRGKNVQSIVFEVPINTLTRDQRDTTSASRYPVLGVWGATYRYAQPVKSSDTGIFAIDRTNRFTRLQRKNDPYRQRFRSFQYNDPRLYTTQGEYRPIQNHIDLIPTVSTRKRIKDQKLLQVSRLGMPLFNQLLMPLRYKDYFNSSHPRDDQTTHFIEKSVRHPELAELLTTLSQRKIPLRNRDDLVTFFLTGLESLNRTDTLRKTPRRGEILRINTSIPPTPAEKSHRLGVFGGDLAGFPNGRRPTDDVTDIVFQAIAGKMEGFRASESLGDNVDTNDEAFLETFPYLPAPHLAP